MFAIIRLLFYALLRLRWATSSGPMWVLIVFCTGFWIEWLVLKGFAEGLGY
jgi:hypothetical protein